jgi:hypothetical protein
MLTFHPRKQARVGVGVGGDRTSWCPLRGLSAADTASLARLAAVLAVAVTFVLAASAWNFLCLLPPLLPQTDRPTDRLFCPRAARRHGAAAATHTCPSRKPRSRPVRETSGTSPRPRRRTRSQYDARLRHLTDARRFENFKSRTNELTRKIFRTSRENYTSNYNKTEVLEQCKVIQLAACLTGPMAKSNGCQSSCVLKGSNSSASATQVSETTANLLKHMCMLYCLGSSPLQ